MRGQGGVAGRDREVARSDQRWAAIGPAIKGVAGVDRGRQGDRAAVVLVEQIGLCNAARFLKDDVIGVDVPDGEEFVRACGDEVIRRFSCVGGASVIARGVPMGEAVVDKGARVCGEVCVVRVRGLTCNGAAAPVCVEGDG